MGNDQCIDIVLLDVIHHPFPIEVKFQNFNKPVISRGFRSFLEAYTPQKGVVITKDFMHQMQVENSHIHFIPLKYLRRAFALI